MSSLNRPLSGKALHFSLGGEQRLEFIDEAALARVGRTARTLVKEGPLRVTLVVLAHGGALAEHHADGPITVHLLSGRIRFHAGEDEWMLEEGDLLSLPAGVPHSVEAEDRSVFLLTVSSMSEQ